MRDCFVPRKDHVISIRKRIRLVAVGQETQRRLSWRYYVAVAKFLSAANCLLSVTLRSGCLLDNGCGFPITSGKHVCWLIRNVFNTVLHNAHYHGAPCVKIPTFAKILSLA